MTTEFPQLRESQYQDLVPQPVVADLSVVGTRPVPQLISLPLDDPRGP